MARARNKQINYDITVTLKAKSNGKNMGNSKTRNKTKSARKQHYCWSKQVRKNKVNKQNNQKVKSVIQSTNQINKQSKRKCITNNQAKNQILTTILFLFYAFGTCGQANESVKKQGRLPLNKMSKQKQIQTSKCVKCDWGKGR